MMKNYHIAFTLLFVILLSGCVSTTANPRAYAPQAPAVENFRPSFQQQLNASEHWSIIAADLAKQLKSSLKKQRLINSPVYLHLYSEDTEFTEAFNDFFTSHLVNTGIKVSRSKQNSIIYNYKIQPVKFRSFRSTARSNKFKLTSLASGVIVAREVFDLLDIRRSVSNALILTGGVDTLTDNIAPQLELIISSSILNNDIYIHKSADIYYANQFDIRLYRNDKEEEENKNHSSRSDIFNDPFYQ